MNQVALAIERALAAAPDRASLDGAFDREWAKVEFAPDAESVVVGVPEIRARQWWQGELSDLELALAVCDPPQAIFWMGLPNHDTYPAGWQAARALAKAGAGICVFHTRNAVIIRHALRFRFRARQEAGGTFLLGEGAGLRRWLKL